MKYRVFYSKGSMMYGVEAFKPNGSYTGDPPRWIQVLPPKGKGARHGKSAYTYYKGVAERWLKELDKEKNTCWNCNEPCSVFSEYQDDGRTFCSLDCLNETTKKEGQT